jgi:hypothetical protein
MGNIQLPARQNIILGNGGVQYPTGQTSSISNPSVEKKTIIFNPESTKDKTSLDLSNLRPYKDRFEFATDSNGWTLTKGSDNQILTNGTTTVTIPRDVEISGIDPVDPNKAKQETAAAIVTELQRLGQNALGEYQLKDGKKRPFQLLIVEHNL